MKTIFDEYIGHLKDLGKEITEGDIVFQTNDTISTDVMDASFSYSTTLISGIKQYLTDRQISVKNICLFSVFLTEVDRKSTSMKTQTALYVIQNKQGVNNALFFSGCSLQEIK